MTASAAERSRRAAGLLGALALLGLGAGCAGPAPTPLRSPLEALPMRAAPAPDNADLTARDLAAAALASDGDPAAQLEALEAIEAAREDAGEPPTGLLPHALDLRNASLGSRSARQRETRQLLKRRDLSPSLRARLEVELGDDPLRLARARIKDSRVQKFGRRVNALVEPIGRSLTNVAMLPMRAAKAVVGLLVAELTAPRISILERQALGHWKEFIERNPDSPDAARLLERVGSTQRRWYRQRRNESVRDARRALRHQDATYAVLLAERALRYAPEDGDAAEILAEAETQVAQNQADRERSLQAAADAEDLAGGRALAVALLASGGDVAGEAERLLEADPRGPLADEARFALALAAAEAGEEKKAWEGLEELADQPDERSNMARHARALSLSTDVNPYGAWRRARAAQRNDVLRFLFLGPLANGVRQRDLPRPIEWLVELPSLPQVVMGLPNRLIRLPFAKSKRRSPGVFARRYLKLHPQGEHAPQLRDWLSDFEEDRGNSIAAFKLAQADPDADPERLDELREDAAGQMLAAADRQRRLDRRLAMLRRIASEYPNTEAGQEAGESYREELEEATPQQIRISRGFLTENPEVAGPNGLALRPGLLDGELENGELHTEGITLVGGREIEFAFVSPSGRESDEPERVRQQISHERLARLVALLDETARRNALLDRDMRVAPDADRDLFFERARLGVPETGQQRVTARSTYTFEGVREKYGLVRGRESILPVDLVLQGNLAELGMGAFPRVRMPKKTPDSFLYR